MLKNTWFRISINALVLAPLFMYFGAPYSKMRRGKDDFDNGWTIFFQIWFLQMV